jgi:hypothetical protein
MPSQRPQQSRFMLLLAHLILYAYNQGYELTGGDLWARDGHIFRSAHYDRLAIDLNLFKDGVWLTKTSDHEFLGEYWESLDPDCEWGGHFADGNHYEMKKL